MLEANLFLMFARPLNQVGIRYAMTGSIAAIFYGEPRLTHDVDFVVFLNTSDIEALHQLFPSPAFYLPSPDLISLEARREQRGHFNIIHVESGFKADFYLSGKDELNAWAIGKRRDFQIEGETVSLAPPEYVIVRKLEYYREGHSEKHLRDIRSILAISGERLNRPEMMQWIRRLGLEPEWKLGSEA
jgi:hypothetical protein